MSVTVERCNGKSDVLNVTVSGDSYPAELRFLIFIQEHGTVLRVPTQRVRVNRTHTYVTGPGWNVLADTGKEFQGSGIGTGVSAAHRRVINQVMLEVYATRVKGKELAA